MSLITMKHNDNICSTQRCGHAAHTSQLGMECGILGSFLISWAPQGVDGRESVYYGIPWRVTVREEYPG